MRYIMNVRGITRIHGYTEHRLTRLNAKLFDVKFPALGLELFSGSHTSSVNRKTLV